MIKVISKSTSSSKVISKPSGLSVGDIMIAVICVVRSNITSAPNGWVVVGSNNLSYSFCTVYKKKATQEDVDATNFTWVSSYNGGGIIYRLEGANFDDIQIGTSAITPNSLNNIILVAGQTSDNDDDSGSFSGYSVTGGDSPTLTEDIEISSISSSYVSSIGVASATYQSKDEITSFNVTITGSVDQNSKFIVVIGGADVTNNFFHFF